MKKTNNNHKIPSHWQLKKLGEVCKKISLNKIKIKQKDYLPFGKYPVVDQGQNLIGGYYDDENLIIPNEPPFIIFGDHTKVKKFVNFKFIPGADGVKVLKPDSMLHPKFFFYLIHTVKIPDKGYARHFQFLEKEFIPIPPLPEQQAIVSKIEELLSELENGKQQLLTAQKQLKVYRQSLLKWAFEGHFGCAQRPPNSEKEGELPKGWKWVQSGELFSFVTSGSRGWAKYYDNKGAIFIRITNMNFDTLELDLRENKIQYVNPPSNSEGIRTKVQEGDFLFSITGYLGMFAIAPKLGNAFVNQHICLCRPKDGFNKKYVGYWIISKSGGIHHLNKNKKGAVKAGLNLDDLKTLPVPICSVEEQQLIVSELESKLTVCDKIEETISQSLQKAETLKQSILKKAFEGKLVTYELENNN